MNFAKRSFFLIFIIIILTTQFTCASVGNYAKNRGNDFLDVFKVKGGVGIGIEADVKMTDLLHVGLGGSLLANAGIYGRKVVSGFESNSNPPMPQLFPGFSANMIFSETKEITPFFITRAHLEINDDIFSDKRREFGDCTEREYCYLSPLISGDKLNYDTKDTPSLLRRFDIEAGATLGIVGGRVGFSPGELVDFILGIFTIDIAKDDEKMTKKDK